MITLLKAVPAVVWGFLCINTIVGGEVDVFQQALAQGTLAIILFIAAFASAENNVIR